MVLYEIYNIFNVNPNVLCLTKSPQYFLLGLHMHWTTLYDKHNVGSYYVCKCMVLNLKITTLPAWKLIQSLNA